MLKTKLPNPAAEAVFRICATGVSIISRPGFASLAVPKANSPCVTRSNIELDDFSAPQINSSSTTRELVPIVRVDSHTIGAGVPGPVTKALLQAFRRKAHEGED